MVNLKKKKKRMKNEEIEPQVLFMKTVLKTSTMPELLELGVPDTGKQVMEMNHAIRHTKVSKAIAISNEDNSYFQQSAVIKYVQCVKNHSQDSLSGLEVVDYTCVRTRIFRPLWMMPALEENMRDMTFLPPTLAWLLNPPLKRTFTGNSCQNFPHFPPALFQIFSSHVLRQYIFYTGVFSKPNPCPIFV